MSEHTPNAPWVSKLPMDVLNRMGSRFGVDPFLIAAICMQESAGKQYAQRFEPKYRWFYEPELASKFLGCSLETERNAQATSYGYMQVMGAVLREQGFKGWFGQAFHPEINIEFGTRHLAGFLKRYNTPSAIASYNAGSPRKADGSDAFVNQHYVDKVMEYWNQALQGAK